MSLRLRRGGVVACLLAATLVLAPTTPQLTPSTSESSAGALVDPTAPAEEVATSPKVRSKAEPPVGALPAEQAIHELTKSSTMQLDRSGTVRSVTATPGKSLGAAPDAFVARYAAAFGLTKSHTISRVSDVSSGGTRVLRYQESVAGLPVLGGEVTVLVNANGSVRSALTDVTSQTPTGKATISAEKAHGIAAAELQKRFGLMNPALEAKLWHYNPTLIGAPGLDQLRPTYWVRAVEHGHDIASVLVDAGNGKVMLAADEHQEAKDRIVCDVANRSINLDYQANYQCAPTSALGKQATTRKEGGAASKVSEVNRAYDYLGKTYDYFRRNFGRDSFDNRGAQVSATVRVCDPRYACPYGNAFWEGSQFVFGAGFVADDVAAHEFTHAVTDYTSNLYYWYQSGAINESFSDVFGELVDLSNHNDGTDDTAKAWVVGENITGGAIRNMKDPTQFGDPDRLTSSYWAVDDQIRDRGGVHTNSGVGNKAAFLITSGGSFNGQSIPGLGLQKSGQLYYRVMHMMPSGGNYEELGLALSSACRSLIGNFGFTLDNCKNTVDKTVTATEMLYALSASRGAVEAPMCLTNPAQSPIDLFHDNFEEIGPGKWDGDWLPYFPGMFTYAASGQGAMRGWTRGSADTGRVTEMKQAVQVPADKEVFAHMAVSLMRHQSSGRGGALIEIQADGGAWAKFTGSTQGLPVTNSEIGTRTRGYGSIRLDLSAYKGQSVKLRFTMFTGGIEWTEVFIDDFRMSYCDNRTSAPKGAFAYRTPQGPELNWAPPAYVSQVVDGGVTRPMTYKWELTYSPAIPGAPTTVDPSGTDLNTLLLTSADPLRHYTITITARTEDGRLGAPVTVDYWSTPPVLCPSYLARVQSRFQAWTIPEGCREYRYGPAVVRKR